MDKTKINEALISIDVLAVNMRKDKTGKTARRMIEDFTQSIREELVRA